MSATCLSFDFLTRKKENHQDDCPYGNTLFASTFSLLTKFLTKLVESGFLPCVAKPLLIKAIIQSGFLCCVAYWQIALSI